MEHTTMVTSVLAAPFNIHIRGISSTDHHYDFFGCN